jgi:hypothetical protein
MTKINIVVSPSFDRRGKCRHGRFDVRLQGGDEVICKATRQPLLDASRVLLRRGVDPSTTICKVRVDAPNIVTMQATIGIAAQYDVMAEKFVRRKPGARPMPGSEIEIALSAAPVGACDANSTRRGSHSGSLKTANSSATTSSAATSPTTSYAKGK